MSNLSVNTINDASGGSAAVLYGLAKLKTIVEAM